MAGDASLVSVPGTEILPLQGLSSGAESAARELLGCYLISTVRGRITGGKIVETEAYLGRPDPASHAAARIGRTFRNAPMFGPPGSAYVYFIYGVHWCFNVVAGAEGDPQAVLVRALEPELGLETMRSRRRREADLTNGPARLCQALGIEGSLNGHCCDRPPLLLLQPGQSGDWPIEVSGRVGIRQAADWPLRFFLGGHPDVSPGRAAPPVTRAALP